MPQAEVITQLEPNEIFVFGSNTAGRHGAGAALQAHRQWGAELGVGKGLTGQCYAFPTLNGRLDQLTWEELAASVIKLYEFCYQNPQLTFLLTKVGCGLADYPEAYIRALFHAPPPNLILPLDWQ
jgi:hypothetical protein